MSVIDLGAARRHAIEKCTLCGRDGDKKCFQCQKPFCDEHLFSPSNSLITELANCEACARKANELAFVDSVNKALALLFSTGISGVTLHSPNGVSCRYNSADVMAGIADTSGVTEAFAGGVAAVTKLENGDVLLEGIFTKENFIAVADDLGWFAK